MFEEIYHEYLVHKNEQNRKERYEGKEGWYHASGAGFCSRKLYYESVEKAKPTNLANQTSMRVMRLGTIVHEDIEKSIAYYNNIYNNNISNDTVSNNSINNSNILPEDRRVEIDTEGEIELKQFNVRGYFDILARGENNNKLYDIKTASNWSFKMKFGRNSIDATNRNHFMQLATYGLGVEEKHGSIDGMSLLYYNKDNSYIKEQVVPLSYLSGAKKYWRAINDEHSRGLPAFRIGSSPYKDWCCAYCQYRDHCDPPKFK